MMKRKIGIILVILGAVLIAAALGLFFYNRQEAVRAEASAQAVMPRIVDAIRDRQAEDSEESPTLPQPPGKTEIREMTVVEIDGYGYIGFVGIPALNLELPVMDRWSYSRLKTAPCRYTGNLYGDDLVIMAHNYRRHFGGLSDLAVGDTVTFTDMEGVTVRYAVAALDVLAPAAVEEMSAGEYDLTLFTCTYGGKSRVTIRCDRVEE